MGVTNLDIIDVDEVRIKGVGAAIASGIAGEHLANLKTNYTTGDLDIEAEIISALNATNTAINAIIASLEAFKIRAAS